MAKDFRILVAVYLILNVGTEIELWVKRVAKDTKDRVFKANGDLYWAVNLP